MTTTDPGTGDTTETAETVETAPSTLADSPAAGAVELELDHWHRLHPLSPVVRGGRAVVVLLAVALPRLLIDHQKLDGLAGDGVVALVVVIGGVVAWLVTRWRVEGPDLRIETGLLRRSSQLYPLRQVQAIDVVRSGLARVLGLAELRLRMAGDSGKGRLACLTDADAHRLREQLLQLASAEGAAKPAAAQPDRPDEEAPVLTVRNGLLAASLLLTLPGLVVAAYVLLFAVHVSLHPGGGTRILGSGLVLPLAFGSALATRFNSEYRLRVAQTPAGLHLSSGLVQTTAETLPTGRVQALRMVEPLLWRPFGWCRVEAAVAGKGTRQENRSEGTRRRALLPVGTYADAHRVIALVLPDAAVRQTRPPGRARWKAPVSYRHLSAGVDATCAVTTSGRLRRVSHWVPLEKVQSIRRTQGPVQRCLLLATVHLDTAGPRMRSALRDRDHREVDAYVERLPGLCAAARDRARIGRPAPVLLPRSAGVQGDAP